MKTALKLLIAILTLCYPLLVYFGLESVDHKLLLLLLVLLIILRFSSLSGLGSYGRVEIWTLASTALFLIMIVYWQGEAIGLKFYPVMVNIGLLNIFFLSLFSSQTVVERIARLREKDFPDEAIQYTRKVTLLWCGFFIVNGSISLYTALATSNEVWAAYNGFIAYILMGCIALGEWITRCQVKKRHAHNKNVLNNVND